MATYNFDGTQNLVINDFDAENDLVVIENLETSDVSEVRNTASGAQVLLFSGVTLTFAGLELSDLSDAEFFPFDTIEIGSDSGDFRFIDNETGGVLVGLEGNDELYGDDGADLILGNQGDDYIYSYSGSDRLHGGQGDDTIYAGGEDTTEDDSIVIYGGLGSDDIFVAGGSDGLEGDVTVYGGNGVANSEDDGDEILVVLDERGSAVIYGNGGDDFISVNGVEGGFSYGGTGGEATVYGGQGDDTIIIGGDFEGPFGGGYVDSAVVYGGADSDEVSVNAEFAVVYGGSSAQDALDEDDNIRVFASTALVYGNAGDDLININAEFVTVYGGAGDDAITVSGNEVVAYGNLGDDTITIFNDGDSAVVYGGAGDDTLDVAADTIYVAGGIGEDTIVAFANDDAVIYGGNGEANPEDGADTIDLSLDLTADAVVYGNGGNDEITIYGGDEVVVYGGQGDDIIVINGDLEGGSGTDAVVYGNLGDDQITVNGGDNVVVYGGQGDDTIVFGQDANADGYTTIVGGLGDDRIEVLGGAVDYTVSGGAGADVFVDLGATPFAGADDENDVGLINDVDFDSDTFEFAIGIDAVADLTDDIPTDEQAEAFAAIGDADTLLDAANAAIDYADLAGDVAVVFEWEGKSFLTVDAEASLGVDGIVEITGFVGIVGLDDFTAPAITA